MNQPSLVELGYFVHHVSKGPKSTNAWYKQHVHSKHPFPNSTKNNPAGVMHEFGHTPQCLLG